MNTRTRKLVYTALFAALTAVGAFLRIPMGYSSVTLQYLFTAMAGLLLGHTSCWGWWACPSSPWAAALAMCSSPRSGSCWG